ncbi:MAG: DEAD/DEAH box helicase family protein [Gammaproteobacteria bacterium]|nr:DEAD/DEAH box helicase family protein [Gammaproteobacteria bacterium]
MSLKDCLTKLDGVLSDFDTDEVVQAAAEYRRRGMPQQEAEIRAVQDHLDHLAREQERIAGLVLESYARDVPPPKETKAKPEVSANVVVTEDAAERARALLRSKLGNLNSGLDPEVVQAGISLAVYHMERGARTFAAYAKAMVADMGDLVKPYLKSWYMAAKFDPLTPEGVKADMSGAGEVESADVETILTAEEPTDVRNPPENPESDPRLGADADGVVSPPVQPDGQDADPDAGGAGGRTRTGGRSGGRGARVSNGGATARGKRSDQPVHSGDGQFGAPDSTAGSDVAGGSPADSGAGSADVGQGSFDLGGAVAATRPNTSLAEKRAAQRAAESIEVKPGDPENIAATLPFLLPSQHEDVAFAERRFVKPEGYGVLFTNGTGTGKTYLGLGVIKRMVKQGKGNILIVVPSQKLIHDWVSSGENLGLKLNPLADTKSSGRGVTITTYANFGRNQTLADRMWDAVVMDEAHELMQNEAGDGTAKLRALRAISMHPDGIDDRARMVHRVLYQKMLATQDALKRTKTTDDMTDQVYQATRREQERLSAELERLRADWKNALLREGSIVTSNQGAPRTRAMFLSATPFAREKNIQWAEGYLFEFQKGQVRIGNSNQGGYELFMVQHFGYRIDHHRLTEPDANVDRNLMQRQFNTWLRSEGALSARTLSVESDYDRKFVLIDSQVGSKIDEGMEWLREHDGQKFRPIADSIAKNFDFLARSRLLEALKAREAVDYIKAQHALGRKVVVFYDYNEGGSFQVFRYGGSKQVALTFTKDKEGRYYYNGVISDNSDQESTIEKRPDGTWAGKITTKDLADEFARLRPDLVALDTAAPSPLQTLRAAFPQAKEYNGLINPKKRTEYVNQFNMDELPDSNLILA